eukprot:COSAG01_NODE_508_length_16107_cov_120.001187_3_plen_171_part_00
MAGDFEPGDSLTPLVCKHIFHEECIASWLRVRHTCPLCVGRVSRASYLRPGHDGDDDDDGSERVGGRQEQLGGNDAERGAHTRGVAAEINPMSGLVMGAVGEHAAARTTPPPGSPVSSSDDGGGMELLLRPPRGPGLAPPSSHSDTHRHRRGHTAAPDPEAVGSFSTERL